MGSKPKPRVFVLVIVIVFLALLYYQTSSWLISGPLPIPDTDIRLSSYNNPDKWKTWDDLRKEYPSLEPSKTDWGQGISASKQATLRILPVDWWDELLHTKTAIAIHLEFKVDTDNRYLESPSVLVLVLDENGEIRGKLYTPIPRPELSMNSQNCTMRFWFDLPQDMLEKRYAVVAEFFGKMQSRFSYSPYGGPTDITGERFIVDSLYGFLPFWDTTASHSSDAAFYTMLDYAREDNRVAPPSSISLRNMLDDMSLVSAFIPALLTGLLVIRKRLVNYAKANPDILWAMSFLFLSLILFLLMVLSSVFR